MDVNNLTGVYNQNPTLQGQYTLQQYLDLFGGSSTGTTTPTTNTTTPTTNSGQGIINQNINQFQNQGDGQDNRGTRTYTSLQDRAPSINRNDRSFIDPLNEKIMDQIRNEGMTIKGKNVPFSNRTYENQLNKYTDAEFMEANPDMFDIKTNKGFVGNTMDNMKTMGGNLVDKFSGLPGVDQTKGFFKNVMDNTMIGRIASMRDATNPKAANYNPNLIDQKDYALRGVDQGGLGYTQDDIGRFTGQAVDPSKANYNPLAGLALQSFAGSNDLGTMYEKELARLAGYQKKKFSQTRKDKIDKINKLIEKQKQDAKDAAASKAATALAARRKANIKRGGHSTWGGYGSVGAYDKANQGNYDRISEVHGADGGSVPKGLSKKSYFKGGIVSLRKGGRVGFRRGGAGGGSGPNNSPGTTQSGGNANTSTNQGPAGGASAGGNYGGNRNPNQTYGGGGGGGPKPGSGRVNTVNRYGPKNKSFFDKMSIHSMNNAKLEKALREGLIDSDEYNVLGGLSSKRDLGFGPVKTAAASTAYNLVQSALGPKFSRGNQPLFDGASDIGRNTYGATLEPDSALAKQYDEIMKTYKRGGSVRKYFKGGLVSLRGR